MYVHFEEKSEENDLDEELELKSESSKHQEQCLTPTDAPVNSCNSIRKRSLFKGGKYNVRSKHALQKQLLVNMQDIFTTLIEARWRITLLVFSCTFVVTWLLFGVLWWIIAHEHGDLKSSYMRDPNREPCVTEMDDFISCFLFSLETQYSTGYGSRSPTTECPDAIFLLTIQSIFGVLIQSTMAGIVFAKLSRPKARSQHIVFSKKAVICLRDGYLSLLFRIGDFGKSSIVGASVRAWLLQHRITPENELLPHYQYKIRINVDSGGSDAFIIWPCTVLHRIDESSPLYNVSAEDIINANFEIVIVVNGTIQATGQTTEARTSYLSSELLWGQRFKPLFKYYKKGRYDFAVDYRRFDETYAVNTPLCSAQELHESNIPKAQKTPIELPTTPSSI